MIVSIISASGAPGATTTALALAACRPHETLVVECCVGSPILAGFAAGRIPHSSGILQLASAAHGAELRPAVQTGTVELSEGNIRVLPGLTNPQQAAALDDYVWQQTARALRESGGDVVVDAGRIGSNVFPTALVQASDHVFLAMRTTLPSIATASRVVPAMVQLLTAESVSFSALVIGNRSPYDAAAAAGQAGLPLKANIPWDPRSAAVFTEGRARRNLSGTPFMRQMRALAKQVAA